MGTDIAKSGQEQLGFAWWTFQGWAGLLVSTLFGLGALRDELGGIAVLLAAIYIALCVMIIRFSKTAFVIGTVLSINPVLWIINGIYIKNRWHDPRVLENGGQEEADAACIQATVENTHRVHAVPAGAILQDASLSQAVVDSFADLEELTPSEEELWEKGMQEVDSPDRRQGLWAKCFSETHGVESAAKAAYMTARVAEMKTEIRAAQQQQAERRRAKEEAQRQAYLDETQKAYEQLPKGICPCCDAIIPATSAECSKCKAQFGKYSAWSVKPLV